MAINFTEEHPLLHFWVEGEQYHLDVRGFVGAGWEPYPHIMGCLNQMESGDTIHIHNLFQPRPLEVQARKMGFQCRMWREGMDHWILRISREGGSPSS